MTIGTWSGSCYCRAIGFRYETALSPAEWSVRACQCGFCRKHDALSVSDPGGSVSFSAAEPGALVRYRFGLKTADFLLCRNCGVYVGAVISAPAGRFGIINLHALDEPPAGLRAAQPVSYDGESTTGRTGRRAERWTPVTDLPRE
ncbi:MAG: hypothetical protein R3176_02015 [Woeseiaceae bacterium]|nr:hypothetical protein [Woeseiaceae bacterium]